MTRGIIHFTAVLALSVGCSGAPEKASNDAPVSETSAATQARSPDIAPCLDTMQESPAATDEDVVAIVDACKDLWLDEGCRAGWTESLNLAPGVRGEHVIATCARSICPARTAPPPALCEANLDEVDLLDEATDWSALWADFNAVVLVEDLGLATGDRRGALLATRLLQLVAVSRPVAEERSNE